MLQKRDAFRSALCRLGHNLGREIDLPAGLVRRAYRHGLCRDGTDRWLSIGVGLDRLTVKDRVQAHGLGTGTRLGLEHGEVDAPPREALHLEHVEALVQEVRAEGLRRVAVGADLTHLALLDRLEIDAL